MYAAISCNPSVRKTAGPRPAFIVNWAVSTTCWIKRKKLILIMVFVSMHCMIELLTKGILLSVPITKSLFQMY